MYYKVLKNEKVIDVLENVIFLKYQKKHDIMIICNESEAQAILSSDCSTIWHEETLYNIPDDCTDKYDSVKLEEIDEYEYKKLKLLNCKTAEEIIDEYTLSLIEGGVL